MKKTVIKNDSRAKVWPRAVKAGDRIYVSAAGMGEDGQAVGPSFEEQFDYVLNDIRQTLESQGSSMDSIVEMTMYFVNMEEDSPKVAPIWMKYIKVMPMVASIGTTGLMPTDPPLLVEVTCSAIIED